MKAMILAAGYGTRLKPLTDNKPKALVEIRGIPLIEIVIKRLIHFGFTDIIINLHHFAGQLSDFIKLKNNFGINIRFSDESELLLDTGGGIKNAAWFFSDGKPFLIYNVDILSDINLGDLYDYHCKSRSLVTLAVSNRETIRKLGFDSNGQLCEWVNLSSGERKISRQAEGPLQLLAYSGTHVIDPAIFNLMTETGVFSIMNVYLRLAKEHPIKAYIHEPKHWYEMGKYQQVVDFNWDKNLDFYINE
jgi:NDP-sugar pyrophosphorylase family protein